MEAEYEQPHAHTFRQSRFLYVVLQGEFALFHEKAASPNPDRLWIMAPRVEGHAYKAGRWLTDWRHEGDLPNGHWFELRHVFGEDRSDKSHCNRSSPEINKDIFMKLGREKLSPDDAHTVIRAPLPFAILPGRLESTPSVVITVLDDHGLPIDFPPVPPKPTVIPILVYKWFEDHRPELWDEHERCVFCTSDGPSDQLHSLQVYASSPCRETEQAGKCHAQKAFTAAAKLLGVNATIDWIDDTCSQNHGKDLKDRTPAFAVEFATPPPGLAWAQINLFLFRVLELNREQLSSDDPVFPREPKFSDSGNCGPTTG